MTEFSTIVIGDMDFSCGSVVKESACQAGDAGLIPALGQSPGVGIGNHSTILAWEISWTGEPGGLQSMSCKELDIA